MFRRLLYSTLVLTFSAHACKKPVVPSVDYLTLQHTPVSSQIVEDDTVHVGWFDSPFEHTDIKTGSFSHPLRRKQWQYVSCTSARYVVGLSTVNVGYMSSCFVYCFNLTTKSFVEFSDLGVGGGRSSVAPNSLAGSSTYTSKECSVHVENHYVDGYYMVSVNCHDKKGNVFSGSVKLHVRGDPLVNVAEIAPGKLVYTHQSSCYRPEGYFVCNNDSVLFDPKTDFAGFDYTQGRHNYKTDWNWAAAGGFAVDSTVVAVCFSQGTKVFYWVNDRLYRIKEVGFDYGNRDSLWRIVSPDSVVSLSFVPVGKRTGNVNVLGLLKSVYYQPFGTFSGMIRPPQQEPIQLRTLIGVTEEHHARW